MAGTISGLIERVRGRLAYYSRGNSTPRLMLLVSVDLLSKLGLEVMPYFIHRERTPVEPVPAPAGCRGTLVDADLAQTLPCRIPGWDAAASANALRSGDVCVGAIFEGELVAATWATSRSCAARGFDLFPLRPGQWCLYGAATHPGARGLGLAPFVRDLLYRELDRRGAQEMLSLSYAFNRSSIRFKEKLGASSLGLCVWLRFFGGRPHGIMGRAPSGTLFS